jgi:hypothetical protein
MPGCRITKSFEAGQPGASLRPVPALRAHAGAGMGEHAGRLDPERPEDAHFTCTACGAVIEEHHRPADAGRPRVARPQPEGQALPSQLLDLGRLQPAEELGAHRPRMAEGQGRQRRRAGLRNDTVGKAWETRGEAPPWEKLRDRAAAAHYVRGTIPAGALVVTARHRLPGRPRRRQVVGWGRDFRRFVVDYGVIPGHISDRSAASGSTS